MRPDVVAETICEFVGKPTVDIDLCSGVIAKIDVRRPGAGVETGLVRIVETAGHSGRIVGLGDATPHVVAGRADVGGKSQLRQSH